MGQVHNFSYGSFEWFIGVVEDRDDPKKLGRLKVRIFGYHPDSGSITTENLPWAMVMQSVTSSAQGGIGQSPVGAQVGTHVVGFFADGNNAQIPVVMGTLAGEPEGEPDTNNLTRGENLQETVVAKKTDSLLMSKADSNALSALSAVSTIRSKMNSVVAGTKGKFNSLKDKFGSLGNPALMTSLNNVSNLFAEIATIPANVEALKSELESEISSVKGRIENIRSIDPEEYVRSLGENQVRDVRSSVAALKSMDFDGALNTIQSIPQTIGQIQRLGSAIQSMGDLSGIVSSIRGLAKSIPNVGAITGFAKTISLANVWNEPVTPAAPEYPLNKITETEGGHIEEYDDTPGSERYHRYHPSGSFTEVHPDGTSVDKVVKDNYKVIMGDDFLHIEGTVKVNIVGNSTIVVNGDATTQVSGNRVDVVKGDYSLAVGGDISIVAGGSLNESASTQFSVKAARIDLN